jgi:hypothetical protein
LKIDRKAAALKNVVAFFSRRRFPTGGARVLFSGKVSDKERTLILSVVFEIWSIILGGRREF